jgi:hypothetical protein
MGPTRTEFFAKENELLQYNLSALKSIPVAASLLVSV